MWTESESESPATEMLRLSEAIRRGHSMRLPDELIRLTRAEFDALAAHPSVQRRTYDPPMMFGATGLGLPVELIDEPPPSYREMIRSGLDAKRGK